MNRTEWQTVATAHLNELAQTDPEPTPEHRAAAALTPLLEAAQSAQVEGDFDELAELAALLTDASGGSLLRKQMLKWSSLTPQQITDELSALIADPDWRAEIDALLAAFAIAAEAPSTKSNAPITRDKIDIHAGATYQPGWQVEKVENITNPLPPNPAEVRAADAESTYLRRLRRESNALPLAQDNRSVNDQDKDAKTPELVNVYVDLQVTAWPDLEQIFQRLSIPDEQRSEMHDQLVLWATQAQQERNPIQNNGGDKNILDTIYHWAAKSDRNAKESPIFAYPKDKERITAESSE
jgi:hypothetical protein